LIPCFFLKFHLGFVNLELYKLHADNKKSDSFRNTFLNLAIPIFSQGEPVPPPKLTFPTLKGEFTLWDHLDIRIGDATLAQLIDYFKTTLHADLSGLSFAGSTPSLPPLSLSRIHRVYLF